MINRPHSRFGAAVVAARKKRGMSQYKLAQKMGRNTRYVSNVEKDRYEPRFTSILIFAEALGISVGELMEEAANLSWADSHKTPPEEKN